ncbi:MAG: SIR2 family protein [Clostridiales bacterium]|nr:SIR2 family protein [Clostridiales bacterium]
MDIDTLKKTIQDFFQENTLTIVGSGLSLSEGIPGMKELSVELTAKVPLLLSDASDISVWNKIDSDLSANVGLEQALHNTEPSPYIEDCIRKITAKFIGSAETKVLLDIIQRGKVLRFTEYLHHFNIRNNGLVVVTTNYDRLIEYACEYNNIRVDTLFIGRFLAHFEPEQSRYSFCQNIVKRPGKKPEAVFAPKVTILKPHGCLSWHMVNGEPYSIPNYPFDDCLIITPGVNKYKEGYSNPFDAHRTRANLEIDCAQRYIIIGYGFGDDHLETHLIKQLECGKPALILTYALSQKAKELVKRCKYVTAIIHDGANGSILITASGETQFRDVNLWDLQAMLREVF